jgi:hypothetical protein
MKLKFLGVLLLVCLMAGSTIAATIDAWMQNSTGPGPSGNWTDATMWKKTAVPPPATATGDEIKLNSYSVLTTINTKLSNGLGPRLTLAAGINESNMHSLLLTAGGDANFSEVRVGHGNSSDYGKWGSVTQTGGTMALDKLQLGYYGTRISAATLAKGTYTISGGTLQAKAGTTGRLQVGCGLTTGGTPSNNQGIFAVSGNDATITMRKLYVGSDGTNAGTGIIEFKLDSDGVSPIQLSVADDANTNVYLDAVGASSVAKLVVRLNAALDNPTAVILLIENKGSAAVSGTFDYFGDVTGQEGACVKLGGYFYTLTYKYDAGTGTPGIGNDIALLPEPATLALLSLGLIAIRRRK